MITPGTAQQQHRETDNVSFTVRFDGKQVNMDPGGVIAVSIGLGLNKIPWARIIFSDGSVEKQRFEKADKDAFSPGKSAEILMGYNQKEETVFKGIITRQSVKVQSGRNYKLEIECRDLAVRTTLVRNSRYFTDLTDTDILKEIVKGHAGVGIGSVGDTQIKHPSLVQYNTSDWDFMLHRADANGMYLTVSDATISMAKPSVKSTPDIQVQFGQGQEGIPLLELEADLDARDHFPGVQGDSWNFATQSIADQTAGKTSGPVAGIAAQAVAAVGGGAQKDFPDVLYKDQSIKLYHGGDIDDQSLQAWADAKLSHGKLSRIKGRASVLGIRVLPGDTLKLNGVSDRFNGTHLVSSVVHQFMKGHWKTDIQFGWDKELVAEALHSAQPDAAVLVPGIPGLHAGLVSKIEGDTRSGDCRIQVRIPYVAKNPDNTQSNGIWARLSSLYAGNNYGWIMRPEIGDEVLIGFVNNDPNDAVIIGSMNSDKNPAPSEIKASDDNAIKGFIARDGMQFLFDDKNNKIHLSTGSGSAPSIEIDGKQKNIKLALDSSNSIELSSSGVKINGTRIDLN